MNHSVNSIKDSSRQEVHVTTDYTTPIKRIAEVIFDPAHSSLEEHKIDDHDFEEDDDYDDDDYDYDDDGEDTVKFPTPDSKKSVPGTEDVDYDVYYGDLRSFIANNFPPPSIDLSKLKGSDFSSEDDSTSDDSTKDGSATPPPKSRMNTTS